MKKIALLIMMVAEFAIADDPTRQIGEDAILFSQCYGAWSAGLEMIKNEKGMENTKKRMGFERGNFLFAALLSSTMTGKENPRKYVGQISVETKTSLLSEYEISQKIGTPLEAFNEIANECVEVKTKAAYLHEEFVEKDCLADNSCFSEF